MALGCDGSRGGCSDELCCESEEFFVSVFVYVRDDLSLCVSWICFSGVDDCAGDSDFSDCFEFVGVADDVSDLGVVSAEDEREVEWCTCDECFVFSAIGYVLDDVFDFCVVPDVCGAELVETLFECSIVVVLVVSDIVEPRCCDCVECEMT